MVRILARKTMEMKIRTIKLEVEIVLCAGVVIIIIELTFMVIADITGKG